MFKYAIGMAALAMATTLAQTPPATDSQAQPSQQTRQATLPDGATAMTLNEGEQIRDTLGAILNSIVTDDEFSSVVDFESMVDHLAAPDRQRIGDVEADQLRDLTATVETLRQSWRQRFTDDDFGDFDEDQVFATIQLAEGRIADPATFAAAWPMEARGTGAAAGGATRAPFEKDTDIAVVLLREGEGTAVTISLINERFDRWRVDIPDSMTAATLISNLRQQLDSAQKDATQWPTNRDAAYRVLAGRVLMALHGTGADTSRR